MTDADRKTVAPEPVAMAEPETAAPAKAVAEKTVAAVQPQSKAAIVPKPMRKPPPPTPKTDNGSEEHKKGLTYYKGIGGVAKNFKTAATWFRQSSAKGNAASQYNLGIMAYLGQGEPQSFEQAAKWFQQAANQDHALAQYNLGFLFYEGKGVEKDDLQAFMWIDRAARLGDEKAIKARDTLEKILPKDILKGK
ncbi:MAG: sel1 repeat family protein [Rhodospirillales bacterium]|nr:sel1 repeat family protein [Rhodospirillales bacterium]